MLKRISIHCIKCNDFRKYVSPKIIYIFDTTLIFSIICSKCGYDKDRKKESIMILKILSLIK